MNSPSKNRPRNRYGGSGILQFVAVLACSIAFSLSAAAATYEARGTTLIGESCLPANGALDPGETNTVSFVIKNTSGGALANVRATLKPNAKLSFISGQQTIGALANDASATVSFSFVTGTTSQDCGTMLDLTLVVTRDGGPAEDLPFGNHLIGEVVSTVHTFANSAPITIRDVTDPPSAPPTRASLYPSNVTVADVPQRVSKVTVTLSGLTHSYPQDIDVLLVAPTGEKIVLMSDAGGTTSPQVNNATLTFDASAAASLPAQSGITSGTFKPTDYPIGPDDVFPSPAPAAPYGDALTSLFQKNPNGVWSLYVVDDTSGDAGLIAGGWSLNVVTTNVVCCISGYPTITPIANRTGDNAINEDNSTGPMAFTVNDVNTPADQLTVTATSLNGVLVPNGSTNIVISGTGASRTINVFPARDQHGTTTIVLTVTDPQGLTGSTSFTVEVKPVNDAPVIGPIPNQSANIGGETTNIPFTVSDAETDPAFILVSAASSNEALVPQFNIFLDGSGANRTVRVKAANATQGQVTITLTASDGNLVGTRSFIVAFDVAPGFPTLTPFTNVVIEEDKSTTAAFEVGGATSLTATSGNTGVIPNSGLVITGTGSSRVLTITPAANQFGSSLITVTASNGNGSTVRTFTVTVTSVNDLPTITGIPELFINEDTASGYQSFTIGDVETPVGSLILSATSDNPSVIPSAVVNVDGPGIRFDGSNASRSVRVWPSTNAVGKATITIIVADTDGGTRSTSFQVNVAEVNDPPAVVVNYNGNPIPHEGGFSIAEDSGEQTINLTGIIPGPASEFSQSLTVTAVSENTALIPNTTVTYTSPQATGTVRFTPSTNAFGEAWIRVTVTDNGGVANGGNDTRVVRVKVTVTPVNDAPTVSDVGPQATFKGQTHTVLVTVADVDNSAGSLTLTATANPANKVSEIFTAGFGGAQRSITIVPAPEATGGVTITYTVSDGQATTTKSFVLNISTDAPNAPPTISAIADITVDEDNVAQTSFVVSDDGDLNTLTFSFVTSNPDLIPTANLLVAGEGATRQLIIIPTPDKFGVADITVIVRDVHPLNPRTGSTSFKLTVRPVEDLPVITLIGSNSRAVDEDKSLVVEFNAIDAETPADQITFERESVGAVGKIIIPDANIVIGHNGTNRTVTITPAPSQNTQVHGPVTVRVRAVDSAGLKAQMDLSITVNPVNDQPTIDPVADRSVAANAGAQTIELKGISTGFTNETQTLTITAVSDKPGIIPNPTISPTSFENSGAKVSANLTFAPVPSASGIATITVRVVETVGGNPIVNGTNSVAFNVTVSAFNNAPQIVTVIGNQTTPEDVATQVIQFTIADVETSVLQLTVSATSSNPTLVPNTPANLILGGSESIRGLIVVPAKDQSGTTTITVTVTDAAGATASRSFTLTVTPVEDAPTISNIPNQATSMNTETEIIHFIVNDAETPAAQLTVTGTSNNQILVPNRNVQFAGSGSNRMMIVIPAPGQEGVAEITVTVRDTASPTPMTASRTFTLTVAVPNTPPTLTAIANQVIDENGIVGPLSVTVGDAETASGFLQLSATSSNTDLVPVTNVQFGGSGANRTVTITPQPNTGGTANITVRVTDSHPTDPLSASRTFTVTVNSTNTDPGIDQIPNQSTTTGRVIGPISVGVRDAETALGFLVLSKTSSNTTLIPVDNIVLGGSGGNRTVTITPAANQTGVSTVTITVTDGGGRTASTTFSVTVSAATAIALIDFNNDGRNDLIWQDNFGHVSAWFMNGADRQGAAYFDPLNTGDSSWRIVGAGDFNGDGKTDLLYQSSGGLLSVWFMDGMTRTGASLLNPIGVDATWRVVGVNDFNGDGKPDILFQHNTGTLSVWYMNGVDRTSPILVTPTNVSPGWRVFGTGDFNGDGRTDIAFQHTDGTLSVWYMNGVDRDSAVLLNPAHAGSSAWRAVGVSDLNNDGKPDVVFQLEGTGDLSVWFMNGINRTIPTLLNPSIPGGTWRIVGPR